MALLPPVHVLWDRFILWISSVLQYVLGWLLLHTGTPQKGADIDPQFYFCVIIGFKGIKPVIIHQEYVSVRSVGCLFCDHIGLEVLIKLRIYRRTVKEAVSSDELLHDTNLVIVKR